MSEKELSNSEEEDIKRRNSTLLEQHFQNIEKFLNDYARCFEFSLQTFPCGKEQIKQKYEKFLTDHQIVVKTFLLNSLKLDDSLIIQPVLSKLMASTLLNPTIGKSYQMLTQYIYYEFNFIIQNFSIQDEFNQDNALEYLAESKQLLPPEFFVKFLNSKKETFFKKQNSIQPNQPQLNQSQALPQPRNEQKSITIITNTIANIINFFLQYLVKKYYQYDLHSIDKFFIKTISNWLQDQCVIKFKKEFPQLFLSMNDTIKIKFNEFYEEIEKDIYQINQNGLNIINFFSKTYRINLIDQCEKELKEQVEVLPFFYSEHQKNLFQLIDKQLELKLNNLQNSNNLKQFVLPKMQYYLDQYFIRKVNIFSDSIISLEQKQLIFDIFHLQKVFLSNQNKFEKYLEFLNVLKTKYFKEISENNIHWLTYSDIFPDAKQNQKLLLEKLEIRYKQSCRILDQKTNWYILFSLCIFVHSISIDKKNSQFIIKKYNGNYYYFMKLILRHLRNGDFSYLNFQIIELLESLFKEFFNQMQDNREFLIFNNTYQLTYQPDCPLNLSNYIHENNNTEIKQILQSNFNFPENDTFKIKILSNSEIRSTNITIIIPGIIFEKSKLDAILQQYIEFNSQNEIYLLNWNKNILKNINIQKLEQLKLILSEDGKIDSQNAGLFLKNTIPLQFLQECKQEMARASKYLSFLLENNLIFPYSIVNVIGIDFGSEIIINTLNNLAQKQFQNIIHDIGFIAGTLTLSEIQFLKEYEIISGSVYSCVTEVEPILSYLFMLLGIEENSIALTKIQNYDSQFVDITFADENFSITNQFHENAKLVFQKLDFNKDWKIIYQLME